jgi:hypothetical protein
VALTNRQIERYSRQLIVPGFGGAAQERLLAARVLLLGDCADTSVLAYLVGAGVGQIDLCADLDPSARDTIIARMRDLNPDSTIRVAPESGGLDYDLALAIVGDDSTLDQARALFDRSAGLTDSFASRFGPNSGIIFARLDQLARIAVIPRRPPCPRCAGAADLLAPLASIDRRADNAGFIASLVALEAIKLLARFAPAPSPTLVEFRGYQSSARILDWTPGSACACDDVIRSVP